MKTQVDSGPNLLLDWNAQSYAPHWISASVGSLGVHVLAVFFLTFMLSLPAPRPTPEPAIAKLTRVTPLVAPPFRLTQKDPNKGKPNQELSVANVAAQEAAKQTARSTPAPALRNFEPPPPNPGLPATPKFSEPPPVQALNTAPTVAPQLSAINVPPPQLQTEEPKLAFETPGQGGAAPMPGRPRIAPPKTSVDDAIKNIARGAGKANVTVREMEPAPDLPDSIRAPQINGAAKILPELLSDPQGVDFKPYIIQVLTQVRRNWMAIIPESVHLGSRRGVVTLQFIVDRDGLVPKLVIASSSGADALDRAAVAG